ncbi:hypothetical protein QOT17_019497 [Balamuthia mandrillaris]
MLRAPLKKSGEEFLSVQAPWEKLVFDTLLGTLYHASSFDPETQTAFANMLFSDEDALLAHASAANGFHEWLNSFAQVWDLSKTESLVFGPVDPEKGKDILSPWNPTFIPDVCPTAIFRGLNNNNGSEASKQGGGRRVCATIRAPLKGTGEQVMSVQQPWEQTVEKTLPGTLFHATSVNPKANVGYVHIVYQDDDAMVAQGTATQQNLPWLKAVDEVWDLPNIETLCFGPVDQEKAGEVVAFWKGKVITNVSETAFFRF